MRSPLVTALPKELVSLTGQLPPAEPGTLFVKGAGGGLRVSPDARFDVLFGRCEPDVHVCVGGSDPHVSRRHGYITRESSRWVLHNVGRLAIRFPGARLVLAGHRAELPEVYTPLVIVAPRQEHLLEVRVAHPEGRARWTLSDTERLVLVCLAQRYLRREPWAQPLTWTQAADELQHLRPRERWSRKRTAHVVTKVRKRLSATVPGLLEDEVPPPLGNTLNHNLITEMLVSATITASELRLLAEGD